MNLNRLKQELADFALVAFKQDELFFSSKQRGIAPLVSLCEKNTDRSELYVADKVIGKAAALLCVQCNAKMLYAKVISEAALSVLDKYKIDAAYDTLVPFIKNKEGDNKCPMEKLASGVDEPIKMLRRAKNFLETLKL